MLAAASPPSTRSASWSERPIRVRYVGASGAPVRPVGASTPAAPLPLVTATFTPSPVVGALATVPRAPGDTDPSARPLCSGRKTGKLL